MAPGTEFARDFCAGIGPLQLGVVLVIIIIIINIIIIKIILVHCLMLYSIIFGSKSNKNYNN